MAGEGVKNVHFSAENWPYRGKDERYGLIWARLLFTNKKSHIGFQMT